MTSVPEIILKDGESRRDYLTRVSIAMLRANSERMNRVIYDEAVCDGYSLANDLEAELNHPEEE